MADGYAIRMDGLSYTAAQDRLLQGALVAPAGALRGRPGVRAGAAPTVTVGSSPESYVVSAHAGVLTDVAGGGTYIYVIPSPVTIPVASRPGTGQSRLDEVVVQVLNSDHRPADGTKEIDVTVVSGGASSGTPTAPTIPDGQLRLREANVPSSGSIALSTTPPRTTALGGVLPLTDATDEATLDPAGALYPGLVAYREDLQQFRGRTAAAWKRLLTTDDIPYDSGWQSITLASGFTAFASAPPQVRRIGTRVMYRGAVTATSGYSGNAVVVVTPTNAIPADMRPPRSRNDTLTPVVTTTPSTSGYRVDVTTTGELSVGAGPTGATTVYLSPLSYFTD